MSDYSEYEVAKNTVLEYIKDRNEYLKVYTDLSNNINAFKKATLPYNYIPKEFVLDFINQLDAIIKEHADVLDINNRSTR